MSVPSTNRSSGKQLTARHHAFIEYLHKQHRGLSSNKKYEASRARANLAVLRRGLAGSCDQFDAYGKIFDLDPPENEEGTWLLVAGLFALFPQRRSRTYGAGTSIGTALGMLSRTRRAAVERRFTILASVDGPALEHHLRQCVQLLRGSEIPLDYSTLLSDLITLRADDPHGYRTEERQHLRLRWARDFHRAAARTDYKHDTLKENE